MFKGGFTPELVGERAVARGIGNCGTRAGSSSTSQAFIKTQLLFEKLLEMTAFLFSRQLANVLVALLTPAALVAFALGIWRVSTDLGWARTFLISSGFFSHWQVWIALAIGLKMLSSTLISWGSRVAKVSQEN